MELKVVCPCGQKFKFDVEPVNGRMPFTVNCPACNADGTAAANLLLAQAAPTAPLPPPIPATQAATAAPAVAGLRINKHTPIAAPPPPPMPASAAPPVSARVAEARPLAKAPGHKPGEFNMPLGVLGAFLGAGLGTALMFGISIALGFKFPFFGLIIGAMTGFGAKLLYKGTDFTLGIFSGVIALVFVGGSLFLLFGIFALGSIISLIVSVSMAWRIASG